MIGEQTTIYIMSGLLGTPYPKGDPELIRGAAAYWRKVGARMSASERSVRSVTRSMVEHRQAGAAVTSFYDLVEDVLPRITRLEQAAGHLAKVLDEYATRLDALRRDFNYMAAKLAADLAVTIAFGFITVGLSAAIARLYITKAMVTAFSIFGAWRRFVLTAATLVTYWGLDSLAYAALDVGAIKAVDTYFGVDTDRRGDFFRTVGANMAFNMAYEAQSGVATAVFGRTFAGHVWTRIGMRMTSSGLVYTPLDNLMKGNPADKRQTTDTEWGVKTAIHAVGRPVVTEPFRSQSSEIGRAIAKGLLRPL